MVAVGVFFKGGSASQGFTVLGVFVGKEVYNFSVFFGIIYSKGLGIQVSPSILICIVIV